MNVKTYYACLTALAALASAAATVSNVSMSAAPDRLVTISYDLDSPAVVTADVLTNGVSIGRKNLTFMAGAVNHKIAAGTGRRIYWAADKAWPGFSFDDARVSVRITAWADDNPPDWMVVDIQDTSVTNITFYCSADELPGGVSNRLYKTERLLMRRVRARNVEWTMGSPSDELGRNIDRTTSARVGFETCQRVTLTNDYYLGIYEMTQAQFLHFAGDRKSTFVSAADSDIRPADSVSLYDLRGSYSSDGAKWPDAGHAVSKTSAIGKLRERTGVTFDLPTSAQWEFACRAGTSTALYSGRNLASDIGNDVGLDSLAWYRENSGGETHAVGGKAPNALGFYDMLGNVWEHVLDGEYSDATVYSDAEPAFEPVGPKISEAKGAGSTYNLQRLHRGGSWNGYAAYCRAAFFTSADAWSWAESGVRGFRLAAPAAVPSSLKGE